MKENMQTYFTPDKNLSGHFIVAGETNDIFCNDKLQIVDVCQQLHEHLIAQGFEAVFFFDYTGVLYCYDNHSFALLTGVSEEEAAREKAPASSAGPMGRRRRPPVNETVAAERDGASRSAPLNMGRITMATAWQQVLTLIRQREHRCALVFSNISTLQFQFPDIALQVLTEINVIENDCANIAVYLFRGNTKSEIIRHASFGNEQWSLFFESTLRPVIESSDEHFIRLGTPNGEEVKNLLNRLRLRKDNPLRIDTGKINAISKALAYGCARKNWGLKELNLRLEKFISSKGEKAISTDNCFKAVGVSNQATAMEELNSLIGLEEVKKTVGKWVEAITDKAVEKRIPSNRFAPERAEKTTPDFLLNVCLMGNPGCGKTELSDIFGRLYYELGLLPSGKVVKVNAGNLVSQNVGGTPALVRSKVQEALGGTLFIDEAYALSSDSHGREAIDQLVNELTEHKGEFALIVAGYERRMRRFIDSNEGLASRIGTTYILKDYTPKEMVRIFELFVKKDADGVEISPEFAETLPDFCDEWATNHGDDWGNAREAKKLLDEMKRHAQARMRANGEDTRRIILTPEDVPERLREFLEGKEDINSIVAQIASMIGLENVKEFLYTLLNNVSWDALEDPELRFVFYGPPGTGKTHCARLMGKLLKKIGVLRRSYVYEVAAKDLLSPDPNVDYSNNCAPSPKEILDKAVEKARGGVLFIDEAHQLADTAEGLSLLRALVPIVEDKEIRNDTAFVLAGYTAEMKALLLRDKGLARRFVEKKRIRFDSYNAEELTQIVEMFSRSRGQLPSKEYLERCCVALDKFIETAPEDYGNAGYIRDFFVPESISERNKRLNIKYGFKGKVVDKSIVEMVSYTEKRTLTAEDLPEEFKKLAGPLGQPAPKKLTVWEKVENLVGKPKVQEYLRSCNVKESQGTVFCDDFNSTGINYAITGPIGSGRHYTARIITAVNKELGLLDRNHIRCVGKGDLEAGFVGQTAIKTNEIIEQTKGGCLVVEYPSSMLKRGANDNSFGPQALGTIESAMVSFGEKFSVIFIDTPEGMEDTFRQFPGIQSKISRVFNLEDFSPEETETIFKMKTRNSLTFEPKVESLLSDFFLNWVSRRGDKGELSKSWGNGNEVDSLIERLISAWEKAEGETVYENGVPKRYITAEMFPNNLKRYLAESRAQAQTALDELDNMTGLKSVKKVIKADERRIRLVGKEKNMPGFYAFLGNPGTGKTTVAQLMGGVKRSVGVLSQGHVVARTARQLSKNPEGFNEAVKLAKNGILFIDEAHQLLNSYGGEEVIQRLLTTIEDVEITKNTCIILAGYCKEMFALIEYDPGLKSRFGADGSMLYFEDYSADELLRIMDEMAMKADKIPQINAGDALDVSDEEFRRLSKIIFGEVKKSKDFGNARFVRNYLHDCFDKMLERLDSFDEVTPADMSRLTAADIPDKHRKLLEKHGKPRCATIDADKVRTDSKARIERENYRSACEEISLSTVLLECYINGVKSGVGTGTIVSSDGYILTCAHVVNGCDEIRARVYCPGSVGGDYRWFDCEILDPVFNDCDMALLKMNGTNFVPASLRGEKDCINETESTLIIGYPLGDLINGGDIEKLKASNFSGKICSEQTAGEKGITRFFIDTTGLHGNSGSPVISQEDGRVIGVFSGSVTPGGDGNLDELNYFYPIRYFWKKFVKGEDR